MGQIEDPQHGDDEPEHRTVFSAPAKYSACECFVRCFLDEVVTRGDLLVVVYDAEPSQPCQDFVSDALRFSVGERRQIQDAPGYLIGYEERERAIALFALMSCFMWKCFLYAEHDQITLYNWEGEIFDAWTASELKSGVINNIIKNFELDLRS
ncbi:MAG TPA: hypothetical protein VK815_05970 [Candidatus Acidoferrales bacterium]|nr:hypothetical protein [Candidatus Acidoferrales bacterium]